MDDYNKDKEKTLEIIICVLIGILIILGGIAAYMRESNKNSNMESLRIEENISKIL